MPAGSEAPETDQSRRALLGILEDLQRTEHELQRIFTLSPDMICTAGLDGRFQRLNPQFEKTLGYPLEELRSQPFVNFVHPEDRAATQAALEQLSVTFKAKAFTNRYSTKAGDYRWLEWNAVLFKKEEVIYAVARDVTDRKSTEEKLHQSEERYRLVVEGSKAGIWDWDLRSQVFYFSPRVAEILKMPPEELPDTLEPIAELFHPEDKPKVLQAIQAHLEQRVPYDMDLRMKTGTGEYRWMNGRGQAIWDESGKAYRMAGSFLDIHDRKSAEAALAYNENLLQRTSEIARFGGFELDLATMQLHVTEGLQRILETESEITFNLQEFFQRIAPEVRAEVADQIQSAMAQGQPLTLEFPMLTPAGRSFWVQSNVMPVFEKGQIVGRVGVVQDITERKTAELALQKLNAELESRVLARTVELAAKNQELEAFSYSVSHDLKAPLRGIDGYSHLLEKEYAGKLDEEGQRFLANIRGGVLQMQRLIDDMLAYSRLERRTQPVVPLVLDNLIKQALAERRQDLGPAQVVVDIDPESILADKEGLAIALRNLIDNAIKFSRQNPAPVIEIRSRIEGGNHILSVKDNGIGFDMKHKDSVFKIFQRLHRSSEYPGTGVGLAMVQKAMEGVGGRVWCESEPGKGAVFHLAFRRSVV